MENLDIRLEIATGTHRGKVTNHVMTWGQIIDLFSKVERKEITVAEYQALSKDERDEAKRGPYFTGGHYRDGVRHVTHIDARSMLTIDMDAITDLDLVETIKMGIFPDLEAEAFVYSSRSHTPEAPRLRIVLPLTRPVDPVEFSHLSRIVAARIDPDLTQTDKLSTSIAQIMYLPTVNKDGEFISSRVVGPIIDPDAWLAGIDLNEGSSCLFPGEREIARRTGVILGDPREKKGIVGAFCRTYPISRALIELIPGVYEPVSADRYTYVAGSSSNGVQVYDDRLLYSWHGTDPVSEQCVNSFDLVRIHRFRHLDADAPAGTAINRLPSFASMVREYGEDAEILEEWKDKGAPRVTADDFMDAKIEQVAEVEPAGELLDAELVTMLGVSAEDFSDAASPTVSAADFELPTAATADDFEVEVQAAPAAAAIGFDHDGIDELLAVDADASASWQDHLTYTHRKDSKGVVTESIIDATEGNISIILQNDPVTAGAIGYDGFQGRMMQTKPIIFPHYGAAQAPLPRGEALEVTDSLSRSILTWIQARKEDGGWGLKPAKGVTDTAIQAAADKLKYDSLIDRITATEWDGVERLDTFLPDYTGCEDNIYTREVSRLFLLGMVVRAMEPGHRFDHMLVLEGPQGLRKTTMVERMGMGMFSTLREGDMKSTKTIIEKTLGVWVCELGELAALQGITGEQIAAFLSDTKDRERMAYARFSQTFQRRAVFVGTTNSKLPYLTKQTGNRRFWPIVVKKLIDTNAVEEIMPQVIAEALVLYREMREASPDLRKLLDLSMSPEAEEIALEVQKSRTKVEEEDLSAGVTGWLMREVDPNDTDAAWAPGAVGTVEIGGKIRTMRRLFQTGHVWKEVMGNQGLPPQRDATAIGKSLQHIDFLESSGGKRMSCRGFGQNTYRIVNLEKLAVEVEKAAHEQRISVDDLLRLH